MQAVSRLTPLKLLTWLHRLRWGVVVCVPVAVLAATFTPRVAVEAAPLLTIAAVLAVINAAIGWSLRDPRPATEAELFAHLVLDTLALSALLYWAGGSSSPFVSLYLLPIAIAAASLPSAQAWLIALLAGLAYTGLLVAFLSPPHTAAHGGFTMHVLGMWATFIVSASLLVMFVTGMAATVRRRDRALAEAREQMLRNERVTAVGALAAGAAHELSTPLSTMAVVVSERRDMHRDDAGLDADLALLERQIGLCKQQIAALLGTAEQAGEAETEPRALAEWLQSIIERWRLMRPDIQTRIDLDTTLGSARLGDATALGQALINLLNNAADASLANDSPRVTVAAARNGDRLWLTIDDDGHGMAERDAARAGRLRFSTKPDGRGLGLILSHVSLERLGGEVSLRQRDGGGTRTRINLPLDAPSPAP